MDCPDGQQQHSDPKQHEESDGQDEGEKHDILVQSIAENWWKGGHSESQTAGQTEAVLSGGVIGRLAVHYGGQDGKQGKGQP